MCFRKLWSSRGCCLAGRSCKFHVASLVVAVSFSESIGGVHGLRHLAVLVVSVGLLCRAIAGACDPVLGVVGVHHIDRGVIGKRDRLARDVLFRVIAVSCRERRVIVITDRLCSNVIATVVREAVAHSV